MNLELPIVENPLIRCYLHHAHTLGIILNNKNAELWVLSHFLQLYSIDSGAVKLDFYIDPYNYECLDRGYINYFYLCNQSNIHKFIQEALKNNYYVLCLVDEFYLHQMQAYQKLHFDHWLLIYGYTGSSYMSIGYTKRLIYEKYEVELDIFDVAIKRNYGITLYRVKDDYKFYYDKVLAQELLHDYVYGINSSLKHRIFKEPIHGKFGYKVYEFLQEELKSSVNHKYPYILYEHKKCVLDFLQRYCSNKNIISQYKEVVDQSTVLKNMYIKESIFGIKVDRTTIANKIEILKNMELDIFKSII